MRHLKSGRKLGVTAPHREALLRSLTLSLIEHDRIKITPARAKEVRRYAERVITLAKNESLHSRRQMLKLLGTVETAVTGKNRVRLAMEKVYSDLAPRFKNRNGGYTQIIRLQPYRQGDMADLCLLQYIPGDTASKKEAPKGKTKKAKAADQDAASEKSVAAKAPKEKKGKTAAPEDKPAKAKRKG